MRALNYIPALLWTAVIFWLLTKDAEGLPSLWWLKFPHSDKAVHAMLFGIGGVLLSLAADYRRRNWAVVIAWAITVGAATEYIQHCCVDSRNGDLADLLADVVGALASLIVVSTWRSR
jgi:VanZ family protein